MRSDPRLPVTTAFALLVACETPNPSLPETPSPSLSEILEQCPAEGWCWVREPTLPDPFAETAAPSLWGTIPPALWAGNDTKLAWGSGPNDVYRVSNSTGRRLEHFDGGTWTEVLGEEVSDLVGGAGRVWVTTERGLLQSDGSGFTHVPVPRDLSETVPREIHVIPEGLLVRTADALLLYDDAWSLLRRATQYESFSSLAGSSVSDLWLLVHISYEAYPVVDRFDGVEWTRMFIFHLLSSSFVTTTDVGETWLVRGSAVSSLTSSDSRSFEGDDLVRSVWVGDGAIWIMSDDRAGRHVLPSE